MDRAIGTDSRRWEDEVEEGGVEVALGCREGYEIHGALGGGGRNFEGYGLETGTRVVIKFADRRNPEIHEGERTILARLRHPRIVRLVDTEERGAPFNVMEYVNGSDLDNVLAALGSLPYERAINIFLDLCDPVQYLDERGLVHRDIKPGNIILDQEREGSPVLADFGLCRDLKTVGKSGGTIFYASPEQIHGKEIDHRSDVYAIGASLYHTVTGRTPYNGNATVARRTGRTRPDLVRFDPRAVEGIPEALLGVISRTTSYSPADRYKSAKEMGEALTRLK